MDRCSWVTVDRAGSEPSWNQEAGLRAAVAYPMYFHLLATAGATNVLVVTFLIPISALLPNGR